MAEPVNPNKLTPFQAAMLKFEQAVRESLEAEQAAQQAARQAAQRPYAPQGRPVQRPQQRTPGYPAAGPFGAPPARQAQPQMMQSPTADASAGAAQQYGTPNGRDVYLNVGEHAVASSLTDNVVEMAPQVTAFDEKRAVLSTPVKNASSTAVSPTQLSVLQIQYANPLMQGVVWAEVLGPPVSRRRGRGRNGL